MGRIKTREIKRSAEQILEMHGDKFSSTFDANKEVFKELNNEFGLESKWLINRILGKITTIKKRELNAAK